jgi:hypothetical protein
MSETTEPTPAVESTKPSKLTRVKSAAVMAGITIIPTAITVGLTCIGYKTGKMNFDAAKLNLETAKINFPQS